MTQHIACHDATLIPSIDGTTIAIHDFGGAGSPVLVSHATGFHAHCWEPLAGALTDLHHVVGLDHRGHGDAETIDPASMTWNQYGLDALAAARHLFAQHNEPIIGIGHSMGGFSATSAVILDEMDFATSGIRKIATMLSVGSDFRYIPFPDPISYIGPRSAGMVAAHYDQFFFDNVTPGSEGSVRYKDYVKDPEGLAFLDRVTQNQAEAGRYYEVGGGQRVIFTPDETHPQNTWSLETGKDTIEFFETAFEFQLAKAGLGDLDSFGITTGTTGQTWWLKEAFTATALVALITMIFPLFAVLTTLPVFNKVYGEEVEQASLKVRVQEKNVLKFMLVALSTLVSAYYIRVFMDRSATELEDLAKTVQNITVVAIAVIILVWIGAIIVKGAKGGEHPEMDKLAGQVTVNGGFVVLISVCYRYLLTNTDLFTTGLTWGAPSVNTIVYWAMASAGLILLITVISSFYFNQGEDVENPFGLKTTPVQFGASVLSALVMVIAVLFVVALVGWIFLTDFRIYTFAIQIFNWPQLAEAIKYIPAFFVFYFAAAISVFVNTRTIKRAWLGDIFAAFLLAGPIVVFLIYNYTKLYSSGVALYPTFSLSAILTVGLVPTLSFAGIIMRRLSLKTGNIWTAVFFTATFFTIITLANTIIYQLSL